MPGGHVIVEVLERLLPEHEAPGIRRSVVKALESGTFAEEDQTRRRIREQADVARVSLAVALRPVQRVDHGVVAGLAVALGMKKMSEQEVQRGRLPVPIADGKGTRGPLTLSGLQ